LGQSQENSTQYLSDIGILKPFQINSDNALVDDLTLDTINYLNTNEGFNLLTYGDENRRIIHRDKLPKDIGKLFGIHPEKLPYELQRQLNRFLSDGWYRVNKNFASFYMTLLANKISEKECIALLTDNSLSSNFSELIKLDNQVNISGSGYSSHDYMRKEKYLALAQGQLTNLIVQGIKIMPTTTLEDIINFKKHHQDELGKFRTEIGSLTKEVNNSLDMASIRQQIEDIYKDRFSPAYNDLKKSLSSYGIKWVAENFIKVSFFSTGSATIPFLMGASIPQALFAGAGISLISSIVLFNETKKETLRNNPYSYLLSLGKKI